MPFTPHRPAPAFTLTNVVNGQTIQTAPLNGITNAMKHYSLRGHLHLSMSGMRTYPKVVPVIGVAKPDLTTFKLSRKSICAPMAISPHDTHFDLLFNHRLFWYDTFTDDDGRLNQVGADVFVDLVKNNQVYRLAQRSFIDTQYLPSATGDSFVTGQLPTLFAANPVAPEITYMRLTFDFTSRYRRNALNSGWEYVGSDDDYLDLDQYIAPTFNSFWNGIGLLSFSTYKPCNC